MHPLTERLMRPRRVRMYPAGGDTTIRFTRHEANCLVELKHRHMHNAFTGPVDRYQPQEEDANVINA